MRSGASRRQPVEDSPASTTVRCAIYTRKSTDEGLSQEFNSLDAQRESAEAYIQSQRHQGWIVLPDSYDDGGFSGGNMDRPALKRLLADIEAGRIDCVVVYKVDRLSRSLLDFARIVDIFEKRGVSFVSVTQQFNTTASLGRLTLNILLSFAQFEREIISERTRDKMSAARRKGKWVGGIPVLGYDVDPRGGRLVVNESEARQVRSIFELYLEHGSLMATVQEANRRGWTTKHWTSKDGREHPGRPMTKNALFRLLTNVIYTGQVNHKGTIYPGEHPAIVDPAVFQRVDRQLRNNGVTGGREVRNKYGALLRGLLHCDACNTVMVHTYTVKNSRRYRYYVCLTAQQRGWDSCPTKSLSAGEIERFVIDRIREIGKEPRILAETLRKVREQTGARKAEIQAELQSQERKFRLLNQELAKVASTPASSNGGRIDRLADLQDQIRVVDARITELRSELEGLREGDIDEGDVRTALREFDPVWNCLNTADQNRLIRAIVERIGYDGRTGRVSISFRSVGFKTLCQTAEEGNHK